MANDEKKEVPAQKTTAPEEVKTDANAKPKSSVAVIVKNIIFAIFIILAIIFCFNKYYQRAHMTDYKEAVKNYEAACETGLKEGATEVEQKKAYQDFQSAREYFESCLNNSPDAETSAECTKMLAKTYAKMAQLPYLPGDESLKFYKMAAAIDPTCEDVPENLRKKFAPVIPTADQLPNASDTAPAENAPAGDAPAETTAPAEATAPAPAPAQ